MQELPLACLLAFGAPAEVQEPPDRELPEGGIVGVSTIACARRFVGPGGDVAAPACVGGMVLWQISGSISS